MAQLGSAERSKLPDSAFAYIDAQGRRRLPIHDAGHVRNALARFNQVAFDDGAARDRARKRLLNAARKFGIVPVGFITNQLQLASRAAGEPVRLPSGFVTMLMTDIEGSTNLLHLLGDRYGELLEGVRTLLSDAAVARGGYVVETRADELFAVFEDPSASLAMAVDVQRDLLARSWIDGHAVRVRIGIHSGYPTQAKQNYLGMAVHTASRIVGCGHGGQIVTSANTKLAVGREAPDGVRFRKLGTRALRGIPEPVELYQVVAKGLPARFPSLRL